MYLCLTACMCVSVFACMRVCLHLGVPVVEGIYVFRFVWFKADFHQIGSDPNSLSAKIIGQKRRFYLRTV